MLDKNEPCPKFVDKLYVGKIKHMIVKAVKSYGVTDVNFQYVNEGGVIVYTDWFTKNNSYG